MLKLDIKYGKAGLAAYSLIASSHPTHWGAGLLTLSVVWGGTQRTFWIVDYD